MIHDDTGKAVADSRAHARARDWVAGRGEAILREQIRIARIPAPGFGERDRAVHIASRLEALGCAPRFDEAGNLRVGYPPTGHGYDAPVIVAAHLDTVFGADVPIEIRGDDGRWMGAGIADNARGLAVVCEVIAALVHAGAEPERPLLFAFTVGEEGSGDLRGAKHLFRDGAARDVHAFIAVDGTGLRRIVHRALGSRRYRIEIQGPGGHSWTDWGRPNPAHVIGDLIHRLARTSLPRQPRSTLTVARIGGGISVNSIPSGSWVEIDIRSERTERMEEIEGVIREALRRSVQHEERRAGQALDVAVQLIGERPAGELPLDHPLVEAAVDVTRAVGAQPQLSASSTDANVPLALGIPAIAVGAGGVSGDAHTPHEWFEDRDGAAGAVRVLALLARIARF